jgi:cbb3-type cytochrome oxidase maturation protein
MYFPYFITYMIIGFVISVAVFLWAVKAGQFKDQQRARFLPLEGQAYGGPLKVSRFSRIHTILLFAVACAGVASTAAVLVYTLLKAESGGS